MRHKESLQYIVQFDFFVSPLSFLMPLVVWFVAAKNLMHIVSLCRKWHDNDPIFGHQIPDYDSLAPNQLARVIKKYLE